MSQTKKLFLGIFLLFCSSVQAQPFHIKQAWVVGNYDAEGEFIGSWDDGLWLRESANGTAVNLYDIAMVSHHEGWAVGSDGNFFHYSDELWRPFAKLGNSAVYGVHCLLADDCWAVGQSAKIYHYGEQSWQEAYDLGGSDIHGIACLNAKDCWAVGDSSKFYHFNGTTWSEVLDLGGAAINDIVCDATNCWAVGDSSKIYRLQNTEKNWQAFADLGSKNFQSIACPDKNTCWAVGSRLFAKWDGSQWQLMDNPLLPDVIYTGVSCADADNCWAVGGVFAGAPVMAYWDGKDWQQKSAALPPVQLNAITFLPTEHK